MILASCGDCCELGSCGSIFSGPEGYSALAWVLIICAAILVLVAFSAVWLSGARPRTCWRRKMVLAPTLLALIALLAARHLRHLGAYYTAILVNPIDSPGTLSPEASTQITLSAWIIFTLLVCVGTVLALVAADIVFTNARKARAARKNRLRTETATAN